MLFSHFLFFSPYFALSRWIGCVFNITSINKSHTSFYFSYVAYISFYLLIVISKNLLERRGRGEGGNSEDPDEMGPMILCLSANLSNLIKNQH